jgi:hypothetical protein
VKLVVAQLDKNIRAFRGNRRFIFMFTSTRYLILSSATCIHTRFGLFMAVNIKIDVFWYIMSCNLIFTFRKNQPPQPSGYRMEINRACPSETLVTLYQIIQRYIPEDGDFLHNPVQAFKILNSSFTLLITVPSLSSVSGKQKVTRDTYQYL